MANEKNLKRPTASEAREKGRAGGIASGKARRAQRTFRELVGALLNEPVKNRAVVQAYAKELGLGDNVKVKELMTILALVNKLKDVSLNDLTQLSLILGESQEGAAAEQDGKLEIVFVDNSKKDGDGDK